jgi:hypothetical protein
VGSPTGIVPLTGTGSPASVLSSRYSRCSQNENETPAYDAGPAPRP